MQDKWIILMQTGNGVQPAWFTSSDPSEKEVPVLYDTQKEAIEKMLENLIDNLSSQLDQVRDGTREPDDVDTENDEWVEPCTLHDDGVITTEDYDPLYDPKTFIR